MALLDGILKFKKKNHNQGRGKTTYKCGIPGRSEINFNGDYLTVIAYEDEILSNICDYYLDQYNEGFSSWYAHIINDKGKLVFYAIYGDESNEAYCREKARLAEMKNTN